MKISLTKLKNSTQSIVFFWQTLVALFFVGLIIILIASVMFWFSLNRDVASQAVNDPTQIKDQIDTKKINQVFEQLKIRSIDSTSATASLPVIVDLSL